MLQVDNRLRDLGQVVHFAQPFTYVLADVADEEAVKRLVCGRMSNGEWNRSMDLPCEAARRYFYDAG